MDGVYLLWKTLEISFYVWCNMLKIAIKIAKKLLIINTRMGKYKLLETQKWRKNILIINAAA